MGCLLKGSQGEGWVLSPWGTVGDVLKGIPPGVQGERVRRSIESGGILSPQDAIGGPFKGVSPGPQGEERVR